MKTCKICQQEKSLDQFVKHKQCKDGYSWTCKKCKLDKQKEVRQQSDNFYTKKYEKTIKGFLMRTYRNMKSRVLGIQYKKQHLYIGKSLLNKELFYEFSINDNSFNELYNNWVNCDYNRKLTPSIDRIDTNKGYELENIQWITHSENSRKATINRYYEHT